MGKGFFSKIMAFFSNNNFESFFEELEDILVEADLGIRTSMEVIKQLKEIAKKGKLNSKLELRNALKDILNSMLSVTDLEHLEDGLNLFLILGVNGVGKTTSLAKLARYYQKKGIHETVLCAGDTFRAAAIEQLKIHGASLGLRVISQDHGSDPGAVLYDSLESAIAKKDRLILADTAGRMHNKENLIRELQKIIKIASAKVPKENIKKILVIDETTGQNAFQQAQTFHEAVGLDALILSKFDSSGKGGIALAISHQLGLPFAFMGIGEKREDLIPFDPDDFLERILGE